MTTTPIKPKHNIDTNARGQILETAQETVQATRGTGNTGQTWTKKKAGAPKPPETQASTELGLGLVAAGFVLPAGTNLVQRFTHCKA